MSASPAHFNSNSHLQTFSCRLCVKKKFWSIFSPWFTHYADRRSDFSLGKGKCTWNKASRKHSMNVQGQTGKSPQLSLFSQNVSGTDIWLICTLTSDLPTFNTMKTFEIQVCFCWLYIYLNHSIISAASISPWRHFDCHTYYKCKHLFPFGAAFIPVELKLQGSSAPRQSLHRQISSCTNSIL